MKVISISIEDIIVPPRRRDEYGDLDGLAENIRLRGLLQPIVVAVFEDKYKLAAGERRLKACTEILGWSEIPCRTYDELSEDERLAIELEENLFRKDLTPLERSKNLVALAQTAEKIIQTEFRSESDQNSSAPKTGRPAQPISERKVAEKLGIPKTTIREAKEHVVAVSSYPELKDSPQKEAIQTAKVLDKLPEPKREAARSNIQSIKPKKAPIPKPDLSSPLRDVQRFIADVKSKGGILNFTCRMNQTERITFSDNLTYCRDELSSFINELIDWADDLREEAS